MKYNEVNDVLKGQKVNGYENFESTLKLMEELMLILRKQRNQKGSIDFDIDEPEFAYSELGEITSLLVNERGLSERIIEDFMLVANKTIASYIYYMNLPFVYRNHDIPNIQKVKEFIKFAKTLGEKMSRLPEDVNSIFIQRLLNDLKESPNFEFYSEILLRSMMKADYSAKNVGHFGLSFDIYTHFTSPIRRYPDLIVHRLLEQYENRNYMITEEENEKQYSKLSEQAKQSSLKERNADACEKAVFKMKSAQFMANHIGEVYTGRVVNALSNGVVVQILGGIRGFVTLDTLDGYYYDEENYRIISSNDKRGYRLGDEIEVRVFETNIMAGEITLVPSNYVKKDKQKKFKRRS